MRLRAPELVLALEFMLGNNFPILITGKPGIGKSDIVDQAADLIGADLIISHPVVSDPTDYKGLPFLGKDGFAHFTPFGELQRLIEAKKKTIFFLDDLGQAPIAVQAAAMQLLLARQINGHKISDNVVFVAASNRREDMAGVLGILEPVKSRFFSIIELLPNAEDWRLWAMRHDMPESLISFIRFRPDLIDDFKPTRDLINSPSPRTVAAVGKMQNAGLPKSLEFQLIGGAAGEAFAVEYTAFLKIRRELPDIKTIIKAPTTASVPNAASVQYALSGALGHVVEPKNIENVLTYLDRMPPEISVATMKDAIRRDERLVTCRPVIQWSADKAGLIL